MHVDEYLEGVVISYVNMEGRDIMHASSCHPQGMFINFLYKINVAYNQYT